MAGQVVSDDSQGLEALVTVRSKSRGVGVTLMTDSEGYFRIEEFFPGPVEIEARKSGYAEISISAESPASDLRIPLSEESDSSLLTTAQMLRYLPEDGKGRKLLRFHCIQCHGLELMVTQRKTREQWKETVMRMAERVPPAPAGQMEEIAEYMGRHFSPDSELEVPTVGKADYSFTPRGVMVEYDLPSDIAEPHDVAVDSAGMVWVTDFDVRPGIRKHSLFRIDPEKSDVAVFQTDVEGSGARSIAFDPEGRLWITILFGGLIARLDQESGQFSVYELPDSDFWPHTLVFDSRGTAWFTGMKSNHIGKFQPQSGEFATFPVPTANSMLYALRMDDQGVLWYTGLFAHKLGRFDPSTETFREYPTPTPLSSTRYLNFDQQGNIWLALFAAGRLARFDPGSETFQEVSLPDPNSSPYDLEILDDGSIWFSDFNRSSITLFNPESGEAQEFTVVSSPYARPVEIELDEAGRLWFCENGTGKVGYIHPQALIERGVWRFGELPVGKAP